MRHLVPPARRLALPAAVIAGAVVLTGCGGSGDGRAELSVSSSYMPQPISDMAAGFLTIANKGGAKDELTSVSSSAAGSVSVHETVGQSMEEVKSLDVPAHGQLVFKSGGNHLMFEKLKRKPKQGEKVTVELHFAKSDPITVEMPVKSATYNPATGH
ncbi:copper chaperone PCu(A)C [Streptomyces pseudovenezuelae]|uniref:Copper(I)-binding protein n=1 Tax=Streptomyces pseudovenezuelae TaxID=67350 RepID=A0ABT6LFQ2_9ACTN|nr:copper chaperone PCu(A)C [Streptomyces pseudovenezuelae]MDH6215128.1 copper(I)-binding protein [Streptomyces pseudovenezuelae]